VSKGVFVVTNHVELAREARRAVLRDRVAGLLLGRPTSVNRWTPVDSVAEGEWMVFHGEGSSGFGACIIGASSALQREREFVQGAAALVRGFGGKERFPFRLSLDRRCPNGWRAQSLMTQRGALLFACEGELLSVESDGVREVGEQRVRLRAVCSANADPRELRRAARVPLREPRLFIPELGFHGVIIVRKEGEMSVEVEQRVEERALPGVRIDLGELEIRLCDLAALRPGMVINLGVAEIERCFIRVGSTVLAEGRIQSSGGEVRLSIDTTFKGA